MQQKLDITPFPVPTNPYRYLIEQLEGARYTNKEELEVAATFRDTLLKVEAARPDALCLNPVEAVLLARAACLRDVRKRMMVELTKLVALGAAEEPAPLQLEPSKPTAKP